MTGSYCYAALSADDVGDGFSLLLRRTHYPLLMEPVAVQATRLARAMVTRYGMSEVLGKVSVNYDDMGQSLSSETRAQVESEVSSCP